jgi:hypothetical protein
MYGRTTELTSQRTTCTWYDLAGRIAWLSSTGKSLHALNEVSRVLEMSLSQYLIDIC